MTSQAVVFIHTNSQFGAQTVLQIRRSDLFLLWNELKMQYEEIYFEGSILAVRTTKFGPLREPIRILLFIVDQLSHIIIRVNLQ